MSRNLDVSLVLRRMRDVCEAVVIIRKLIEELKGELSWKEFYKLTGISVEQLWKIEHFGHSCPPYKIQILCELAKQQGRSLSRKEMITLSLGEKLTKRLADLDLHLLLAGRIPLDTWLTLIGSQKSQAKILGLEYSTIFHRRAGRFKRFWPKRAVEIARRSNYEIDVCDLCGITRLST